MNREWEPGDPEVAIISWRSASRRHGGSAIALRCSRAYDESHWRTQTFGEIADATVYDIRPLVVIDPEDREQVERLALLIRDNPASDWVDSTQAALREFANPTPPKPDEPTGLGAVVEDAEGRRWVRFERPDVPARWYDAGPAGGFPVQWELVAAVRVLSEGVTA